jgi:hypothetical protein
VVTDNGTWVDQRRIRDTKEPVRAVGFSPRLGRAVCLTGAQDEVPQVTNLTNGGTPIPFGLKAEAMMSYKGRVYLKSGDKILEVLLNEMGDKIVPSTQLAALVLPQATQLFWGVVVQDLLGSTYISVFPESGLTHQVHVKELDKHRIVEARYEGGVLVVIGFRKGRYDRFVFRFDKTHEKYDARKVEDVSYSGINLAVLDSGVAVLLNEDEKLELFSTRMGSTGLKIVEDSSLGGDITLSQIGAQLLFVKDNRVYKAKMR